jgi:VCBS repeat-containing protein
MASIGFTFARNSKAPGWAPEAGTPHDALWTEGMTGFTVRPAGGGASTTTTAPMAQFDSAQGSIDITGVRFAGGASVNGNAASGGSAASLDWSADGSRATLALDRAWNTIKNVEVGSFSGTELTLANWVDAWVHLANDFGQTIRLDGSKRGEVTTGGGDDTVWIGVDSNGAGWTNHFRVATGAGNDVVEITLATRDYSISSFKTAYDPRWTSTDIDTGTGNDSVAGGGGADRVRLGEGDDSFAGRGGNDWADGGAGTDVARFSGNTADYRIERIEGGVTVTDLRAGGPDGIDTLLGFERLAFADGSVQLVAPPPPPPPPAPPEAIEDRFSVTEDGALTVGLDRGLLANDTDPNGDALTAVLDIGPENGSLTLNADGTFTYVPDANFAGTDSFTYRASDGNYLSAAVVVTLVVEAVNDAPVAADDAFSLFANESLTVAGPGVLGNDADIEAGALSVQLANGPAHGTLALAADGSFTYTPDAGFLGEDSFTYAAIDAQGGSAMATVTLTVSARNQAPVGQADQYAVAEDGVLAVTNAAFGVLANDSDPDGTDIASLLASGPQHGQLSLNINGTFIYRPNADWHGTDSFTYIPTDGSALGAPTTVTIVVAAVNDAPRARADAFAVTEDSPLVVVAPGVAGNDSDPDGDALGFTLASGPSRGELAWASDGSFTYIPAADFFGTDSFSYTVSDGTLSSTATVTLTVANTDDGVVAIADHYAGQEDAILLVSAAEGLLANDIGPDGGMTVLAGAFTTLLGGSVTVAADGGFTYIPAADVFGTDSFTYVMRDADGDMAEATATIVVEAVGEGPANAAIADLVADGAAVALAGVAASDRAGASVAGAKDVNGDGIADIAVGASGLDPSGRSNAGGVYVTFGGPGLDGTAVLGSADAPGFRIIGARANDQAGISVALIDDMNGDGLAEIAVGATGYDVSGVTDAGGVFVVFGRSATTDVDLAQVANGNGGFLIRGAALSDGMGIAVASVGDMNGDGRGDLVVGASLQNAPQFDSGAAYVIFGKATGGVVNVGSLGAQGFAINGAQANDHLGFSVTGLGDVNGDGRADIGIGARLSDANGTDAGSAFVVFGKTTATAVNLSSLGTQGFRIGGGDANDLAAYSLAAAGDVNGDGLADILVGAPGADAAGPVSGASYIVYGKAGTAAVNLASLGAQGIRIDGEGEADQFGHALAAIGDANGDGFGDFLFAAPGNDETGQDAGAVYLVFGRAGGFGSFAMSELADGALRLTGTSASDAFGHAVAAAGDVNSDGLADFLVTAPLADAPANASGAAWLVFGQSDWAL